MGSCGLERDRSKCEGSERGTGQEGQGGSGEAPHVGLLLSSLYSQPGSFAKGAISHPSGILV